MQLSEIRTAISTEVELSLSSPALTQLVNRALRKVAAERDWPWLELTETGTWGSGETITMDATAKAVRSVVIDDRRYDPMAEQDADTQAGQLLSTGFSVAARELRVVPQPAATATYTLWYVAYENVLAADADEPLIPDAFIDAVVMLACSMAHDRPSGNTRARDNFNERYRELRKDMLGSAAAKRGAQLPRMRQDVI